MSSSENKLHAVKFTVSDLKAMRMAVSRALDSIPTRDGIFYDMWNRLLPELDIKIENCSKSESKTRPSPFRVATNADVESEKVE